jgi:riboflavin kinase/FMN adenylyltransferase
MDATSRLAREELGRAAPERDSAVSIGVFDGVHRGHRYLIGELRERAATRGLACGVITLHPHPVLVLRPEIPIAYLGSLEERVELLESTGVDFVVALPFSSELAQLSARDFMVMVTEELRLRFLLVGLDFALGRGREGNAERLAELGRELGYEVESLAPLQDDGEVVSSTAVRNALAAGDMETVAALMGRPFSLRGPVVRGAERGKTLGFPTANLGVSRDLALPPFGVYVTRAFFSEGQYPSVTNIGLRPTFATNERAVEVHVLDFEGEAYGREVRIELLHRLREERRFSGPEELTQQIRRDVEEARRFFEDEGGSL